MRFRPQFEYLEDRTVLNGGTLGNFLSLSLNGGTLTVSGTAERNVIQIVQDDYADTLRVTYGQLGDSTRQVVEVINVQTLQSSLITKIVVVSGDGDDNVQYVIAPNVLSPTATNVLYGKVIQIQSGTGNDSFTFDLYNRSIAAANGYDLPPVIDASAGLYRTDGSFTGPIAGLQSVAMTLSNPPVSILSPMSISVDSGDGFDKVSLGLDNSSAKIGLTFNLGNQDDQFWAGFYGVTEQAATTLNASGNAGLDSLVSKLYGEVKAGGNLTVNLNGDAGNDTITTLVKALLSSPTGSVNLGLSGGFDNDTINSTLDLQAGSIGTLAASLNGDAGNDVFTVLVGLNTTAQNASLSANGGGGIDTLYLTAAASFLSATKIENIFTI